MSLLRTLLSVSQRACQHAGVMNAYTILSPLINDQLEIVAALTIMRHLAASKC